jgi:hypothetical protein
MKIRLILFAGLVVAAMTSAGLVQAKPGGSTVIVTPNDLAPPPDPFTRVDTWYFYDDTTDQASTALAGAQFTTGPATPPLGVGSLSFDDPASTSRLTVATNQFAGVPLADIAKLSFDMYTPASNAGGTSATLFLNVDVDFDTTAPGGYVGRLVYLPQDNGSPVTDAWQTWNAFDGSALWQWSHFGANGNKWPDGNTSATRTLSDLLAAFPSISVFNEGGFTGQLVIRAGHPGPGGLQGSVDKIVVGDQTFNFEPVNTVTSKDACKNGGWALFNTPTFKNQGDCIKYVNTGK